MSKAYYQQLKMSEDYPKLNQVIFLGFLNFNLFKNDKQYFTRHLILEETTNEHYFQDFELNFVELLKFKKTLEELKDIKDKWIYFVKNAGNMTMIPKELQEPKELLEAFEVANQMSWSKKELEAYDARGILIQDERGHIEFALQEGKKIGLDEGKKIGLDEGRKIGLDEGEKIGREEERKEIARAMKKNGIGMDIIISSTGLTKMEIENL